SFMEQYGSDEKGRRQAEQAYIDLLENSSLTPERMRHMMRDAYVITMLYDQLQPAGSVTEEDVRSYYDEQLKAQQEGVASSPAWFGENTPDIVLAAPEGYVETVRITLDFTGKQLAELQTAADTASKAQADYRQNENGLFSGIKKDTFERAKANYERVLNEAYAELDGQLEAIRAEALDGADFIKLMEQKSEDTHLISYFVSRDSTHVEEAYLEAALALANVGDISAPVHLQNGSCIILLKDRIVPGVRSFEEARGEIQEKLTSNTRSNATLVSMQTEFGEKAQEAGIVTLYPEKL
ncbi:MAG TPA: peptidylprolyl isomerase, partial [Feifaniaceae bacterium]|nr:peptidylprolyl isomerase [Feifaniaceae bacterium]